MAMYCEHCHKPRPEALVCSICGGPLRPGQAPAVTGPTDAWMASPLGRVLLGLLLAQGLFHAARSLATGILLVCFGPEAVEAFQNSLVGVVFWQVVQGLALLAGTAPIGSGDPFGFFYGMLVGLGNGLICTAFPLVPGTASGNLASFCLPLIQAAVGLFGGWLGSLIWLPAPEIVTIPVRKAQAWVRPLLKGPILWTRVAIGAAITIAGAISAGALFDAMLEAGHGRLATSSYLQDRIFTWEIKILLLLLGGAIAGANTMNGFKQGLVVGVASALALALLPRYSASILEGLILFVATVSFCTLGGWFGGQLLPPILRRLRVVAPKE